jgi:hypothetical protein
MSDEMINRIAGKFDTTAAKVAAAFQEKIAMPDEGKIVGDQYRLTWSRMGFSLEELPAKGKKKLTKAFFSFPGYQGGASFMIPENILRDAKVDRDDSVEEVMKKIDKAWGMSIDAAESGKYYDNDKKYIEETKTYIRKITWSKEQVHYLKIAPEGTEPFSVEAKNFSISLKWTEWKAYSPNSDFQGHDPSYTMYESKSAASARKLYQMLKADPSVVKSLTWDKFGDWLAKNNIAYDTNFSSWR